MFYQNILKEKIEKQFEQPINNSLKNKKQDLPAFDLVRAAVNLMVAAVFDFNSNVLQAPPIHNLCNIYGRYG